MVSDLATLEATRLREGLTPEAHVANLRNILVERTMRERFGNLEENILDRGTDHVLSAEQGALLHEHTLHYGEKLGIDPSDHPITKAEVARMGRAHFAKMKWGQAKPMRMMEWVGRIGRKIEAAEAAGKWDEAYKLAQSREIAFWAAKETQKAAREEARMDRTMKQLRKREPEGWPLEYSNAGQDIGKRMGYSINRTYPEDIQREWGKLDFKDLNDFVEYKRRPTTNPDKKEGEDDRDFPTINKGNLTVAPFLMDPTDPRFKMDIKNMSTEDARAVFASVESLRKNARLENSITIGGEVLDRAKFIKSLVEEAHKTFRTGEGVGKVKEGVSFPVTIWAGLLQMETMWRRLARGEEGSPFMKVNSMLMSAGNQVSELERRFAPKFRDVGKYPTNMMKPIENDLFFEPNERGGDIPDTPRRMTVRNGLAVLQNMGNPDNADVLARGQNIRVKEGILDAWKKTGYKVDMHHPIMDMMFKVFGKEDFDRAQKLGDLFEEVFELSENTLYDLGARPGPRIELMPIETPWGTTYKGWYHPLIYDSDRPAMYATDAEGKEKQIGGSRKLMGEDPWDDGFHKPTTSRSYQRQRTGYAAPLLLNFDAVNSRLKQMLNDIAMRPAVSEAYKIFTDSKFKQAIIHTYGPEYANLLMPYLKDIAGQRRYVDQFQASAGKIFEYFYQNAITTLVGFNPGTVLKHFPTALQTSAAQVGTAAFAKEFANTWLNPMGWANVQYALSKSNEIPRRARNWRETMTGASEDVFPGGAAPLVFLGKSDFAAQASSWLEKSRQAFIKAAATPVAWSDMASVVPMWMVEYKKQIRAGVDEGEAIDRADAAVRAAHGSTATTARPYWMRQGVAARATMPFYTFFNDMLQRQYETAWRAKDAVGYFKDGNYLRGKEEISKVAMGIWAYFLFPAIVEQAVSPIVFNKESYGEMAVDILINDIASSWPGIRELVHAYMGGQDPTVSVFGGSARAVVQFGRDMARGQHMFDRNRMGQSIKHFATLVGVVGGYMNAQEGRWGEAAYNVSSGREHPRGFGQWYTEFRMGDLKHPEYAIPFYKQLHRKGMI
jgi:hypothetical protein